MAKVVGIIKDDPITGVEYGEIEVPETQITLYQATNTYNQMRATRAKHNAQAHKNNTKQK